MEYKTLPIDILTGYRRLFGFPIDADSVFENYDKALIYAQSSRSYDGQLISVIETVDETHVKIYPYFVENKTLRPFNSDYYTKEELSNFKLIGTDDISVTFENRTADAEGNPDKSANIVLTFKSFDETKDDQFQLIVNFQHTNFEIDPETHEIRISENLQERIDQITTNEVEIDQLQADLRTEIERAIAAETQLQKNIDTEAATRKSEDDKLQAQVDKNVKTIVSVPDQDKLTVTTTDGTATDVDLARLNDSEELAAEIERALAAEKQLQDNIDAEEAARITADENLQQQIDSNDQDIANINTKNDEQDAEIQSLHQKDSEQDAALTAEIERATEAETDLQEQIHSNDIDIAALQEHLEGTDLDVTYKLQFAKNPIPADEYVTVTTTEKTPNTAELASKQCIMNELRFEREKGTTVSIGGISKGAMLNDWSVMDVLVEMLYPYVPFTMAGFTLTPNGGTYEWGSSVTVTNSVTTINEGSESITSVTINDGGTVLATETDPTRLTGSRFTIPINLVITTTKNLKTTVVDKKGTTLSRNSATFTFVYPFYYGSLPLGTLDADSIKGLTKVIQTKGSKKFTFTHSNQCCIFAYPSSYGNLRTAIDQNNFDVTASFVKNVVSITGLDGKPVNYNVYVNSPATLNGFAITFNF